MILINKLMKMQLSVKHIYFNTIYDRLVISCHIHRLKKEPLFELYDKDKKLIRKVTQL